ncbi:ATP-dependent nuclease [Marinifilum flexuosum]|uniref:ATP-dependent nuclease n=1 Tax=Marinifilum flexuosum TaxID=1117708 RepID=UPI0024932B7B|nr:AAA family ATPase [Marinifilum flexuosum]
MKLIKLSIRNFRGINGENNCVEFLDSNIIFLIGKNNATKSTFLHAYEFFTNPRQTSKKEDFFNYSPENTIEIIGEFLKDDDDNDNRDFNKDPEWINKWVNQDGKIVIKKEWSTVGGLFNKYTLNPNTGEFVANGFGGIDSLFKKYAPTPIFINAIETEESFEKKVNEIIDKEFLKKVNTTFEDEYTAALGAIDALQKKITDAEEITTYNERINRNFQKIFPELSLRITQKREENIDIIKAFKTNHSIAVEKHGIERKETFEQHGHGIIRQALFNFLAFLKNENESTKKEYIILFEEPELYLHPKSVHSLREELYELAENSPFQIICATHSPGMIDISKPHSSLVRVVKNQTTEETITYQVGHSIFQSEENRDFVQMINRFNPNVCETFYADDVILVEGDTEALIFREVLKQRYPDKDCFILNTGSKNNIPFFQKILTHFRIHQTIIHDSDTRYLYDIIDGTPVRRKKKDDSDRVNSAWSINESIWTEIQNSNELQNELARRFVSIYDFESANGYLYDSSKGKPLSAYEFAKELSPDDSIPLNDFVEYIVGNIACEIDYSMENLNEMVIEPDGKIEVEA